MSRGRAQLKRMEADQNKLLMVVVAGGFLTSTWQVSC